jgi:hypothetical protein
VIGRILDIALASVELQVHFVAGITVAETLQPDIAAGLDAVFDHVVGGAVGIERGLAAGDFGVLFQDDFAVRAAGHAFGLEVGRRVRIVDRTPGRGLRVGEQRQRRRRQGNRQCANQSSGRRKAGAASHGQRSGNTIKEADLLR